MQNFHRNPRILHSKPSLSFIISLFAAADKMHDEDIEISDILFVDDHPGIFHHSIPRLNESKLARFIHLSHHYFIISQSILTAQQI